MNYEILQNINVRRAQSDRGEWNDTSEFYEKGYKSKLEYEKFFNLFADILKPFDLEAALSADLTLECVKLEKRAILTDFLWFSPRTYCMVHDRIKKIFQNFTLMRCRFFPVTLVDFEDKPRSERYWFFLCDEFNMDVIDFSLSQFTTWSHKQGFSDIEINSYDDLQKFSSWQVKKVVINSCEHLDLFRTALSHQVVVSDRLFKTLSDAGTTGLEYEEIEVEFHS